MVAQSALAGRPGVFWAAALSSLLMIIGGFGPWATALNIVSVSGTRGDGWIVIAAGAFGLAMLWLNASRASRGAAVWAALAALGSAIVVAIDLSDLKDAGSADFFGERLQVVRPAWGIYMALVASIGLLLFAGVLVARTKRAARSNRGAGLSPPTAQPWVPPAHPMPAPPSEQAPGKEG